MGWRDRLTAALGLDQRLASLEADNKALQIRLASARRSADMRGSGVAIVNGEYRYEAADQLRSKQKWDTLARMENDPAVRSTLHSTMYPLICAEWEFKPASDDPKDVEVANFCDAVLLRGVNDDYGREYWCQSSWRAQRLPEILSFLVHGFSMFAKSWREVNGKHVYDKIQWLEPSSVDHRGWRLNDADELEQIWRTYRKPDGQIAYQEPIDVADIFLYVWDMKGARLEGSPFVRAMYGPWMRKDFYNKQSMIFAQKVGAPAPIGSYPDDYSAAEQATFEQFVAMCRGTSPTEAYFAGRKGANGEKAEISFAGSDAGQVDRMRSLIDAENMEIARTGAMHSQMLGESATGSKGVSTTQSDREIYVLQGIAEIVCEWENEGVANLPGPVEELVVRNFANIKALPKLCVSRINPGEAIAEIPVIAQAITSGLLPNHPELRRQVADRLGFVLPDDAFEIETPSRSIPVATPGQMPGQMPPPLQPTAANPADTTSETAADAGSENTKVAASVQLGMLEQMMSAPDPNMTADAAARAGLGRRQTVFESVVLSVASMKLALDDGSRRMASIVKSANGKMIGDIVDRGKRGKITSESLSTFRRSRPQAKDAFEENVRSAYLDIAQNGQQHVRDEYGRQRAWAARARSGNYSLAAGDAPETIPPGGSIPAAAAIGISAADRAMVVAEMQRTAGLSAEILIDDVWNRLVDEAINEYSRLIRAGTSGAELWVKLDSFLNSLSEAIPASWATETANEAYAQGRSTEIQSSATQESVGWATRLNVLDASTCSVCWSLNGISVRVGTESYDQYEPPNMCEGGDRCRCEYVGLTNDFIAAADQLPFTDAQRALPEVYQIDSQGNRR